MWKISVLALLLWAAVVSAQTGYFVRTDCDSITSPVNGSTVCLQSSTTGGRTIGHLYSRIGGVWTDVTGNGSILGSIALPQLAVGTAANTIGGTSNFEATSAAGASQILIDDTVTSAVAFQISNATKWSLNVEQIVVGGNLDYGIFNNQLSSYALYVNGADNVVNLSSLTASKCLRTDASKNLVSATDDCGSGAGNAVIATIQAGTYLYCADSAGSDTYTCSLTPTLTAYTTGSVFEFKPGTNNTGPATLNINTLGAKPLVTDQNIALTDNMLIAGAHYMVQYDGTSFRIVQHPQTDLQVYTSTGDSTWTKPAGARLVRVYICGPGGGGAAGTAAALSTLAPGGGGGGGGVCRDQTYLASDLASSITVHIGTGGTKGTGGSGTGADANAGDSSTFGSTIMIAYSGGGGGGSTAGGPGGSGAGFSSVGGSPPGSTGIAGGTCFNSSIGAGTQSFDCRGAGSGTPAAAAVNGFPAWIAGASGGCSASDGGGFGNGGTSILSGAGGGGGGGVTAGNANEFGGSGGSTGPNLSIANGGAANGGNSASACGAGGEGGTGQPAAFPLMGYGGGGGASKTGASAVGCAGGDGGTASGGGGGGGANGSSATGGSGGNGGNGIAWVWSYF